MFNWEAQNQNFLFKMAYLGWILANVKQGVLKYNEHLSLILFIKNTDIEKS